MAEQVTTRPERTAERTSWRAMAGDYTPDYSILAPLDRVRWASVLAGLFTTLAFLIFFSVLGIAIGLSTFDANNPGSFGLGAGVYGIISALVSFFLGGWVASRTAAVAGMGNAVLNGAMVWIVTIPFIVNILGMGLGTLLGTATDVATAAAGAAATVADDAADAITGGNPGVVIPPAAQATDETGAAIPPVQATVQGAVDDAQQQLQNVTPQDVENTARDLSGAAWGALLALGLSAGAAVAGGAAGRRTMPTEIVTDDTPTPRTTSTTR